MGMYFSPLPFTSLLFSAICKASSDNHFAFLHFFFLKMVFITTYKWDGRVEGCVLISYEITEITTSCWQTIDRRMLECIKKKHSRVKEKPQQDSWRSIMKFKIKLHIHQRVLKGTNKALCATEPRKKSSDPYKRLSQTCLWVFEVLLQRHASTGTFWGNRASGSNSPRRCGMWHKSSWRRLPLDPLEPRMRNPETGEQLC